MATLFPQTLGYVDPDDERIKAMEAALMQARAPMFTPEQIAQRRAANQRDYALGMLGQLSGDDMAAGVGAQVFKKALGDRKQQVTERGVADPITGEFTYDPQYLEQRDRDTLEGLRNRRAAREATFVNARISAEERAAAARERAADRAAARADRAASGQVGAFQPAGFTPNGESVVTNTKTGVNYILNVGPDGLPQYKAYGGVFTPKTTFDKQVVDTQEQLAAADRADELVGRIKKNPDAFGPAAAAIGLLPGKAQGWASTITGMDPGAMKIRAEVTRDAAMELNRIYGAAQSAGELARASSWAPNSTDDLQTTLTKLESARDWARDNARRAGRGVVSAARQRSGGADGSWDAAPAAPGQGGGLSAAEQAELAALRARFPRGK
jgi:hypothetical protein